MYRFIHCIINLRISSSFENLKYNIVHSTLAFENMTSTLNDSLFEPNVIVLSIFGYTNKVCETDLHENTLTLMLQEIGRTPDKVLLPSEGNSSIYIQYWAESLGIKTLTFYADWSKHGRMAQILRDDRMYKECTHALVFLSEKTNRLEKFAERLAKKGKIVFTSSHNQTLTQFELSQSEQSSPKKGSAHGRKSDKGIASAWQKYQTTAEC